MRLSILFYQLSRAFTLIHLTCTTEVLDNYLTAAFVQTPAETKEPMISCLRPSSQQTSLSYKTQTSCVLKLNGVCSDEGRNELIIGSLRERGAPTLP